MWRTGPAMTGATGWRLIRSGRSWGGGSDSICGSLAQTVGWYLRHRQWWEAILSGAYMEFTSVITVIAWGKRSYKDR